MKNTHVLLIKFKNKISDDEVQFFRSSIIQNWVTSQIYYTTIM